MSVIDKCFTAIRKNFSSDEFSDAEIRQMVKDFSRIQETAGVSDFLAKANEYRKELELREAANFKRKTRTLLTTKDLKNKLITDLPAAGKEKALYERAQNIFTGGGVISEGGNFSVQYSRASYSKWMRGAVEQAIKDEGLEKAVQDGEFSRLLRNEMMNNGSVNDPRIQRIAKKMQGTYEFQKSELQRLGVDMGEIENYMGWQAYDKRKLIAAGKEAFVNDALNSVDHAKTFKEEFSLEQKTKRLSEAYDSIVTGDNADPIKKRSLHYKSGDAVHLVMTKYGMHPSTIDSMFAQIDHTSRRLALMQKFGPNFEDGFKNFKSWLEKTAPSPARVEILTTDGKVPTGLAGLEARAKALKTTVANLPMEVARRTMNVDDLYADVIGKTTAPSGAVIAEAGSIIRTWTTLTNLGGAALSALFPDFASNAALIKSYDGQSGIGSNIGKIFKEYAETVFNRRERAEAMMLMGIYADDMIGGIANIHGELNEGSQPGMVAEAARAMFKWTGLTDHTQNIRAATAKVLGARLATHSERSFNELPEQLRANFKRYSIGDKEWDVMRQAVAVFPNGLAVLSPAKIWDLPDKLFNKKLTRGEVFLKYATALNETTELGTLTGDAYTRTLFYQGTTDDKVYGQISRMMAQFKQAPVQNMRLMNRLYNSNVEAPEILRRFGATGKFVGDMSSVAPAFVYMTTAGLLTYYAKELAAFKTPPDPRDTETLKQAFLRGGGGGLMADYMFAEYNKSYRNPVEDMAGPVAGNAAKLLKLFAATARGEFSDNKFEALKFAIRQMPGQNIWWAKGTLEHVLLDSLQEYMSPGYTIKMDKKLEKRGQQRLFPSADTFTKTPDRKVLIGGDE